MPRTWVHGVIAGMLACGVAGCTSAPPLPEAPLRIAHELWAGYYPLDAIAADSAAPVRVQSRVIESGDQLFAEFAAGAFDGIAASVVDLIRLQQAAPDLRIVGCTDESAGADAIVARDGIRSAAALAGKRVGVSLGTFSEMLLDEMLRRSALTRSDVIIVNADAASVPALLRAGKIDAGETWEPYLSQLPADSFPVVFSTSDTPKLVLQCLAFHDQIIRANPDRIRQLIQSIVQSAGTLVQSPEVLRERAARGVGRPIDDMPAVRGVRWLSLEENYRLLGVDGSTGELPVITEPHVRFLATTGALRSPPDVAAMTRADLLPPRGQPTP